MCTLACSKPTRHRILPPKEWAVEWVSDPSCKGLGKEVVQTLCITSSKSHPVVSILFFFLFLSQSLPFSLSLCLLVKCQILFPAGTHSKCSFYLVILLTYSFLSMSATCYCTEQYNQSQQSRFLAQSQWDSQWVCQSAAAVREIPR